MPPRMRERTEGGSAVILVPKRSRSLPTVRVSGSRAMLMRPLPIDGSFAQLAFAIDHGIT